MIDIEKKYLEIVKRILTVHVPDCEIRVFGSRVTGRAGRYSDLDILLIGQEPIDWHRMEALKDDFAESDLPFMVDLTDWHAVANSFGQVIVKQGNGVRLELMVPGT